MIFSMIGRNELAVMAVVGMLVVSSTGMALSVHSAAAQQPASSTPGMSSSAAGAGGGLKFFIKLNNNASSQQQQPQAGGTTGNATKKVTVNVHVQQGQNGKPATLPITAVVPQSTKPQDMQLCAQIGSNQPVCQPLTSTGGSSKLDLTQQSGGGSGAASAPPA
jgi:hypothetical protein